VFHIVKTIVDAHGAVVSGGPLPVSFESEIEASAFLEHYLALVFAAGKCGHQDRYWWGCDETADLHLHRYTIEH
jgi:hypothetical protein